MHRYFGLFQQEHVEYGGLNSRGEFISCNVVLKHLGSLFHRAEITAHGAGVVLLRHPVLA